MPKAAKVTPNGLLGSYLDARNAVLTTHLLMDNLSEANADFKR